MTPGDMLTPSPTANVSPAHTLRDAATGPVGANTLASKPLPRNQQPRVPPSARRPPSALPSPFGAAVALRYSPVSTVEKGPLGVSFSRRFYLEKLGVRGELQRAPGPSPAHSSPSSP